MGKTEKEDYVKSLIALAMGTIEDEPTDFFGGTRLVAKFESKENAYAISRKLLKEGIDNVIVCNRFANRLEVYFE